MYTIHGIQHLGVGVAKHADAWKWYRKFFGLDIPFFNAEAPAPLMNVYTNNKTITKRAAMVLNLKGGCAMEVVCPTSFEASHSTFDLQLGDLGIYIGFVKSDDVKAAYTFFKKEGAQLASELTKTPNGLDTFYVYDLDGNLFQVIPDNGPWFTKSNYKTGGTAGCSIGVTNIEKSMELYGSILGYDKIIYDVTGVFEDWNTLKGGKSTHRRVLIAQSNPSGGGFSKLAGTSYIELVEEQSDRIKIKIFQNRIWADIGFVHLGFDVRGMNDLGKTLESKGYGFTCDTKNVLSMGDSTKVHCTYIEDVDGTWIELIEVYKVPIIEKLGINLNVAKRPAHKPLPDLMLKALKFVRIKD